MAAQRRWAMYDLAADKFSEVGLGDGQMVSRLVHDAIIATVEPILIIAKPYVTQPPLRQKVPQVQYCSSALRLG